MKKIFIGLALGLASFAFAQQYPNNGWGNNGYYGSNDDYYSDEDDRNLFPDDYYYNYPQDYYPQDYYQSYYNDYRQSIYNIDWNRFFVQQRLNRWQIDQILYLNNLYSNFAAWDNFYRYNPDRWYYDRFYAMERILGPRVFVVFQNRYYNGYNPIAYFQNYRRTYYVPRFRVMPRYRNVNINVYRVDRNSFRNDNPTLNVIRNSGFRNGTSNGNSGFRNDTGNARPNSGFRNPDMGTRGNSGFGGRDNGGFRNNQPSTPNASSPEVITPRDNGGFRNNQPRNFESPRPQVITPRDNGGFRNQPRMQNSSPRIQNSMPRQENNSRGEGRSSGFRGNLVRN